jgi:hypothetical protein
MTRNFESLKSKLAYSRLRLIPGLFEAYSGLTEAYAPLLRGKNKPLNPPLRGLEAYCPEGLPPGGGAIQLTGTKETPARHRLFAFMVIAGSQPKHIHHN